MHSLTDVDYLSSPQADKLRRVLSQIIPIYPSPSSSTFPTLHIVPKDFLRDVFSKLNEHSIDVADVRLNGGAASYVLIKDSNFQYRDIDILFTLKTPLTVERETTLYASNNEPYLCDVWTMIKYIICSCLIEHMPHVQGCTPTFLASILDTYTKKNIQINSEQDSWALLSLQSLLGRNLELKFIEQWKRQWQFSVDSFQIGLQSILFEPSAQTTVRTMRSGYIPIEAINAVTFGSEETKNENDEKGSATPLEFGFFPSPSSPSTTRLLSTNQTQSNTLAIITLIGAREKRSSNVRSRSIQASTSNDDPEDLAHSFLQFQISVNEDIDDGIVMDADDLTNDDDESNYRTPPMELPSTSTRIPFYSAYRNLREALFHLDNQLIATYEPEKLRGGGLLKYCDLLARSYKPANPTEMIHSQRYMCSRFFIDFKTITEQISVITKYVSTHILPNSIIHDLLERSSLNEIFQYLHFQQINRSKTKEIDKDELKNARICLLFFENLLAVIQQSCVCLTGDDKDLLLHQIRLLKECYHNEYEHVFRDDPDHQRQYHSFPPSFSSTPSMNYGMFPHWRPHPHAKVYTQRYPRQNNFHAPQRSYYSPTPLVPNHPRR